MPDNIAYLNLGLGVVFGLLGLYITILRWRFRKAHQQRQAIKESIEP